MPVAGAHPMWFGPGRDISKPEAHRQSRWIASEDGPDNGALRLRRGEGGTGGMRRQLWRAVLPLKRFLRLISVYRFRQSLC